MRTIILALIAVPVLGAPLLVSCVSLPQTARPQTELPLPLEKRQELSSNVNESQKKMVKTCSYFNFVVIEETPFVERDRFTPGWQSVERDRKIWLDAAQQAASALGFTLVSDIEQAGFSLQATGGNAFTGGGRLVLSIGFAATPRLMHHAFLASLNDKTFPFNMNLGSNYSFTFPAQGYTTDNIWLGAMAVAELAWSQTSRTVLALCEVSSLLVDEGITMEELRQELVKEIQRIRQQRVREKQMKQLEVDASGD